MKIANQLFDRSSLNPGKKDAKAAADKQGTAGTSTSVPKKVSRPSDVEEKSSRFEETSYTSRPHRENHGDRTCKRFSACRSFAEISFSFRLKNERRFALEKRIGRRFVVDHHRNATVSRKQHVHHHRSRFRPADYRKTQTQRTSSKVRFFFV